LSDEAWELADRHNIEEFKLRYVVALPAEYHAEIVRQIIDFNLTSKQIKELCEGSGLETDEDTVLDKLPAAAVKMARVTQVINALSAQDVARALIQQEGDATIAQARLQALQKLLSEAQRYLQAD
jgi:hypothetical protein